ncbi:GNAT superfamily N-acetyltransferase [Arthrobacter sp. V1I9]|uniref:GNAT family N-acetyltransferase n=1 Tax=Arthrobacter sp. V1I9 TaxID=3042275 RepID=UPI002793B002|nr:GNAT family N-acetyltransferase [Arthrobacter sp. V1I9]MDQ0868501.1 GNAT superfamily N-acetyltransferase [Arthrobacter sp. V1I9]
MAEPDVEPDFGKTVELAITAVDVQPRGNETPAGAGPVTAQFQECHALRVEHELAVWGNLDRCDTLQEAVEYWRGNEYEERRLYLAKLGAVTVGMCSVTFPLRENTHTAGIQVLVVPAYRRQGLGRALLEHAEAAARERGRTSLDAYHEVPLQAADGAALLPAKSGAGGLPLDEPAVAFAVAAGYELEQVERSSRLDLPVAPELLDRLEADAPARAAEYTITGWDDTCPEDLVHAYARLKSTMTTDVPIAGMDWEGEDWDAARVREEENTLIRSGVQSAVTAARHRASGQLVAYTVLNWRAGVPNSILQQDTLVISEHRGRRLGVLAKVANLRRAQTRWPSAKSVLTWNANENQHMLAINIALGFKPAGYEGEWQKRLG